MLRSAARFKHIWSAGDKQYVGCWESVPRRYGNALGPVSYANRAPVPKDWVLRGSGIHGPENGEVMKLALWNRLKQKRPQRQGVTTADLQEFYRMEITVVWWMFGLVFFVAPLNWWGKKYRMVHDHYPWMPKRMDGTRGVGPYAWRHAQVPLSLQHDIGLADPCACLQLLKRQVGGCSVCFATFASVAMLRSAARFKHIWSAGDKQYVGCWESVPRRYGNALGPVSYANRAPVPKDWVLRGSGIHGPENGEVMKLALWNRLKQKRPQRQGVTTADLQEFYRMEITVVWWMFGLVFFVAPLNWWGKKYRMVHDHYPWMPKRMDGTRGVGPYAWFFE
ncbi:unnamed protein product [Symbiodinium natans]|uniref:Uncharacterized protein n=2 Tax=Symbiodinium natans TaxID=878477 RepID=A0A812N1K9_9DINO|nr:unnamed protein product [Symbiodinium natans]